MGVSPLVYAPNTVAALVGWGTCWLLAGRPAMTFAAVGFAPWIALAAIAASFLGPGFQCVHRWLALGPLRLNASAALAPCLFLGLASHDRDVRERTTVAVLAALLVLLGAAALAWLRVDHLPAVLHVERVLEFARGLGAVTYLGALLALVLALIPLAWPFRSGDRTARTFGAGAILHSCGSIAATSSGHFPVPLLGAGAAPVLGWYGLALVVRMCAVMRCR
jgi:hypothetical protein